MVLGLAAWVHDGRVYESMMFRCRGSGADSRLLRGLIAVNGPWQQQSSHTATVNPSLGFHEGIDSIDHLHPI